MKQSSGDTAPAGRAVPWLMSLLRPERGRLLLVVALNVLSVGAVVAGPWILGLATDIVVVGLIGRGLPANETAGQAVAALRAAGHGRIADLLEATHSAPTPGVDLHRLGQVLLVAAGVFLLSAVFGWLQGRIMAGIVHRTAARIRESVEQTVGRLPLRYFDRHPHGEILSRATNDVDNITVAALQEALGQLPTAVLTVLGVLVVMFWISPLLAAVSLVTVPLLMVALAVFGKRSRQHFAAQWAHTGHLTSMAEETFSNHAALLAFSRHRTAIDDFAVRNERLRRSSLSAQFLSGLILPAVLLIGNLNYVTIAVLGGYQVAVGVVSLGAVQAFIQYSRRFTTPITQIAGQLGLLQSGLASVRRVFEFVGADPEPALVADDAAAPVDTRRAGRIELRNVSFRYEPGVPMIEGLTLEVAPGRTVAIVGPTGSGKTTLVNLVMRFYEIDDGRILLDGTDYRDLSRDHVRRCFGMVLQDTWLFGGTIRENIAYGRPDAGEEDIVAAARAAFVDDFVRTLPDGYDTVLDAAASSLSTGQQQLLTIARAFLADPDILILDEATSSVDTRTEVMIQDAMARLCAGRTSIVIAHRLSTVREADTIVVLDGGRVVEQGGHEALLARRGLYHGLYRSQFAAATLSRRDR